jgi:hypothetical protein
MTSRWPRKIIDCARRMLGERLKDAGPIPATSTKG